MCAGVLSEGLEFDSAVATFKYVGAIVNGLAHCAQQQR
jgi:hypothetical protein